MQSTEVLSIFLQKYGLIYIGDTFLIAFVCLSQTVWPAAFFYLVERVHTANWISSMSETSIQQFVYQWDLGKDLKKNKLKSSNCDLLCSDSELLNNNKLLFDRHKELWKQNWYLHFKKQNQVATLMWLSVEGLDKRAISSKWNKNHTSRHLSLVL